MDAWLESNRKIQEFRNQAIMEYGKTLNSGFLMQRCKCTRFDSRNNLPCNQNALGHWIYQAGLFSAAGPASQKLSASPALVRATMSRPESRSFICVWVVWLSCACTARFVRCSKPHIACLRFVGMGCTTELTCLRSAFKHVGFWTA